MIEDRWVFESGYFLSQEYVNQFANEVRRKAPADEHPDDLDPAIAPEPDDAASAPTQVDVEGDPTDGTQPGITIACTDNWKVSQADEVQRMWNIYEEMGILHLLVDMA